MKKAAILLFLFYNVYERRCKSMKKMINRMYLSIYLTYIVAVISFFLGSYFESLNEIVLSNFFITYIILVLFTALIIMYEHIVRKEIAFFKYFHYSILIIYPILVIFNFNTILFIILISIISTLLLAKLLWINNVEIKKVDVNDILKVAQLYFVLIFIMVFINLTVKQYYLVGGLSLLSLIVIKLEIYLNNKSYNDKALWYFIGGIALAGLAFLISYSSSILVYRFKDLDLIINVFGPLSSFALAVALSYVIKLQTQELLKNISIE